MFGRSKQTPQTSESEVVVIEPALAGDKPGGKNASGKKGRPTPTRREAEAARRKPLVPADREAAKRASKEAARADRIHQREALNRGDESALPKRDRGPVKRYIRNSVDSRLNIGEILLPIMLIVLVMMFVPSPAFKAMSMVGVWVVVLIGVLDAVLLWRRTKKGIIAKFGEEPPKGAAAYTVMRAMQMRMSRVPRPQVKRGDKSWR